MTPFLIWAGICVGIWVVLVCIGSTNTNPYRKPKNSREDLDL